MRKNIFIISILLIFLASCNSKEFIGGMVYPSVETEIYNINMKRDILSLMMAYPEYIEGVSKEGENVYLIMKSGNKILYDDKIQKNFQEKLNNPDIQDMMEQIYPINDIDTIMDKDIDPGRIRVDILLNEVYGKSRKEIELNLEKVVLSDKSFAFNKNNNASIALKESIKELSSLAKKNNKIYSFLFPSSGTYNYRVISGTNRLSPHSFGIAIDLKRDNRDYWKWASIDQGQKRLSEYPKEIVRVFEKNGFVWGGKWYHFDILHFEYRPEIIIKARSFSDYPFSSERWYEGLELTDEVKQYIKIIDSEL